MPVRQIPDTDSPIKLHIITIKSWYGFLTNTPWVDITQGGKWMDPEVKPRHLWVDGVCTIHMNDKKKQ